MKVGAGLRLAATLRCGAKPLYAPFGGRTRGGGGGGLTFDRSLSSTSASQEPQPAAAAKPTLTLYTGTDCQLCDVAKAVLDDVAREVPFTLNLYNIRDDRMPDIARWRRAYQYDIPVLHLNGKEIGRHRLQRDFVLETIRSAIKADHGEKTTSTSE